MNAKTISSILLLVVAISPSALPADEPTLSQVAKAAKVYLRDSAEFPLTTKVEVTFTDLAGHVRQHKTGSYKFDFHGYNVRSNNGRIVFQGSWRTFMSGSALKKSVYATSIPTLLPAILLDPDIEKKAVVTVAPGAAPDLMSVAMKPLADCDPFQWENESYASPSICGSYELQLGKDDFVLKRFAFDASALPVSAQMDIFDRVTILRYHSETEFQKVFLPGDPKPFLVPKLVTVTVETDKGKLVMSGNYTSRK